MDYRESAQIEPEILENMVACLRKGDSSLITPIINGHMRMVMAIIAGSRKNRRLQADIEGAAYLALVESVNNCCPWTDKTGKHHPSRLHDNNITFYITANVKYMIKEEFSRDHIMCVPSRTIRYKLANGEIFEELRLPSRSEMGEDTHNDTNSPSSHIMPFLIPIAKQEFPSLEFTEALGKATETIMDQVIIKMRSEGCTYEEIGPRIGYHFTRIGQIVRTIEARFDNYYN